MSKKKIILIILAGITLLALAGTGLFLFFNSQGKNPEKPDTKTEKACLLYTSPSPRDGLLSRMPSSA